MNSKRTIIDNLKPMPKCLFIIDPVPTNRIRLAATLEAAQYEVTAMSAPAEIAPVRWSGT